MKLTHKIKSFLKDESGATMIEYVLLVALIAIVVLAAIRTLGTTLNTKLGQANTALTATQ